MVRFSITTLGCKVNQYDGAALAADLRRAGLTATRADNSPDLVVVNTCCVTASAMRKSRQTIRKQLRKNTDATVLITGCYSDYDTEAITRILTSLGIPERRVHVTGHHSDLADAIQKVVADLRANGPEARRQTESTHSPSSTRRNIKARRNSAVKRKAGGMSQIGGIKVFPNRQRAFVKVQDGCDAFCSYCIVPYTRPVVWSKTIDQIRTECRDLVNSGHKEIVLAGVFLGALGRDTSRRSRWDESRSILPDLLSEIAGIEGLWRVRLSSLEPGDLSDKLLDVYRTNRKAAPHFHLPLQSGSQRVLERMKRQYTADDFRRTIDRVREAIEDAAITTDIIVGFPGETDEDFQQTLDVARHARFSKIHTFPFSAIEGTTAWEFRNEAPAGSVVKSRIAQLGELESQMAMEFRRKFLGRRMEALVESTRPAAGVRQAMTDRYITVRFNPPKHARLTGKVVSLHIDDVWDGGLYCHGQPSVLQ
ncbi:MAG: tRNA (N(6)-L-threonylcarbamoyladenosine(37)-C(2))-methylthiotransferase MtaB [Phycisphaerae bacterium]|jgi:threonylcarbamoyladenosine tRNA methylthiotransferase MtaB|nr:tRNA (N(6)-L-threonylcarbamoyladenosine(37)-C(2))-methylthiotransferase MtaB [Phycisphaerae bacterium]